MSNVVLFNFLFIRKYWKMINEMKKH